MLFFKKIILLLTLAVAAGLFGCSSDTVSLEEALLLQEKQTFVTEQSAKPDAEVYAASGSEYTEQVYVYVCGAVKEPGVYTLPVGSRIVAAIDAAGGFLPEAAKEAVNLAQPVSDGMQITVPDTETILQMEQAQILANAGLVDINKASIEELCTLSGIGESKARAIIAYREEIGGFQSAEQLKDVSGIGDNLFEQIKNNIYIE